MNDLRFIQRGFHAYFDFKHFDLSIDIGNNPMEMHASCNNYYMQIQRDKICQSTDDSCLSAIVSEPLPLHGIHYWEFKIKASPRPKERVDGMQNENEIKSEESKNTLKDIENASGLMIESN